MTLILSGTDGLSDIDGTAATPAIRGTDANTGIFFPAADTIAFSEGGVESMRIDSSGNVLIGSSTANAKLYSYATSGTTTTLGKFEAAIGSYTGTSLIAANTLGASSTYNLFSCITDSDGDAGGPFTQFLVRGDGNVGIGTSSPSYRLEVKGPAATAGQLSIHDGAGDTVVSNTNAASLLFQCRDSSVRTLAEIDGVHTTTNGTGGAMVFQTRVSDVLAERMRIDSDGKLGVNTGGAAYGGTVFRLGVNDTNYCIAVNATAGGTTDMIDFYSSGTFAGKVSSNGATTAYNTSSDYRLKEDITPLTGALTKVSALKPVTFKWKLDGNSGEGFIAHELAEVCPYAVNGEKDEVDAEGNIRAQSIDTSFLVATLTAAIQEQQALITALTARITALETQNADNPVQGETP